MRYIFKFVCFGGCWHSSRRPQRLKISLHALCLEQIHAEKPKTLFFISKFSTNQFFYEVLVAIESMSIPSKKARKAAAY